MANEINLVVGAEVTKQLDGLLSKLDQVDKKINETARNFIGMNSGVSNVKTPQALTNQAVNNSAQIAGLAKEAKMYSLIETEVTKLTKVRATHNRMTAQEAVNQGILNKNALENAKANSALIGSYDKLSLELNRTRNEAKNLGATFGEQSKQFKTASTRVQELDARLKGIDATLGQSQRNVGNYRSGFNGLGNSINQLTRELPAFTFSAQTGILALSNNIPILTDEIGRLQVANKELIAQGKPVESIFKKIVGSLLSLQTAMGVGILLLTVYGKEIGNWVTGLFGASQALEDLNNQQEKFNKTRLEGAKKAVQPIDELNKYLLIAKSVALSDEERAIAVKKVREQYPFYTKALTDAQILEGKTEEVQKRVVNALKMRAEWQEKVTLIQENETKLIDLKEELRVQNALVKTKQANFDALSKIQGISPNVTAKAVNELTQAESKRNKTAEDAFAIQEQNIIQQQIANGLQQATIGLEYQEDKTKEKKLKKLKEFNQEYADYLANQYALRHQQLTDVISTNKDIADDESISFDKRTLARTVYFNESIKLAELEKAEQLRLLENATTNELAEVNKNYSEKKITIQEKNKAIYAIEQQTLYDRQLIYQNFGTEFSKVTKEYSKNIDELIDHVANKKDELYLLDTKQLAGLKLYSDALKKVSETAGINDIGKFKDVEEMKVAILKGVEKEKIEIDLADIQRQMLVFNTQDKNSTAYQDLMQKELDLKLKLANITAEADKKEAQEREKKLQDMKSYLRSFQDEFANNTGFSELFNVLNKDIVGFGENWAVTANSMMEIGQELFTFLNQQSEAKYQAEITRLESQRDIAIQFAGDSTTARAEIERQYEERRKALERKKAEEAKKVAVFNAIIDTAQAVVGALAEQNYAGAILFGIIGAAQIAMIQSQPIPAFAMGGTHEGGMMLVNDGNGSNYGETIVTPDGKISQPTGRNVVMNAPKGTEIYTADQWQNQLNNLLLSNGILPSMVNLPSKDANGMTMQQMETAMTNAIAKMPENESLEMNFDERGINIWKKENGRRTEILNARLRTKSRNV